VQVTAYFTHYTRPHHTSFIETCGFTAPPCSFNAIVFHHVMVMKCNSGCLKIILDSGVVVRKLQFLAVLAHLTWILSAGILKTKFYASTVDTKAELWYYFLLLLFILTANGFLPSDICTTVRHNTQITHITQNNTTIKRNTAHKSTHTLHKVNKLSLEYNNHNYNYIK
jgi:hypothetical protein